MLISFTSWLAWIPNGIWQANFASGLDKPAQSSRQNLVSCAFIRRLDFVIVHRGPEMGRISHQNPSITAFAPATSESPQAADPQTLTRPDVRTLGKLLRVVYRAGGLTCELVACPG